MIQQISSKLFFLFLVLFCTNIISATAQKNVKRISSDTIVIYETKVVYDTLFVYDTIRLAKPIKNIPVLHLKQTDTTRSDIFLLQKDSLLTDSVKQSLEKKNIFFTTLLLKPKTLNTNIILRSKYNYCPHPEEFLCKSPATNFKKDINRLESDKLSMKNREYMAGKLDKSQLGISVGVGGWWAQSSDFSMQSNVLTSPRIGVFFEKTIAQKVSLKVELNYSWLLKKGITIDQDEEFVGKIYSSSSDSFSSSFPITTSYSDIFTWEVNGEKDSEFNLSQISIPIKIGYRVKNFQPYVGFEYKYSLISDKEDNGNSYNVLAGIEVHLSNRLSLALNYTYGVEEELKRDGNVQGRIVGDILILPSSTVVFLPSSTDEYLNNNTGSLSSQRIDFSLYLNLFRQKK